MQVPSSPFEITRPDPSRSENHRILNFVAPRGLAIGAHSTDSEQGDMAQHNNFIGFLSRDVRVEGVTLEDVFYGVTDDDPVGLEKPFQVGTNVSLKKGRQIELEGADLLQLSGTGALTSGAAIPSNVSLLNGRWRLTQASETVNGVLTAKDLTPLNSGELRVQIEVKQ